MERSRRTWLAEALRLRDDKLVPPLPLSRCSFGSANKRGIMNQQIYWHTTVKMPDDLNLTPIPEKVDVAIIGGGYTGLSAARILAKRGVKVVVLEAETIGWGASSRNGGMTLTGLKVPMQTVIKNYGREMAKELFQCSIDSVDTVEQIVKEENIDCGFARTCHLLAANKPKNYESLK